MINQLAQMGVSKGKILHTAQSLYHDIVPATAAGLTTMWINRRKHKTGSGATATVTENIQPDFEVASLAEFVSMHQAELRT
jgi:FMN phosphatase YigB (HAD superfamily)